MKYKCLLIVILLAGAILRFYRLGEIPKNLYSDEVAIGYNAYSIINTGRDEFGKFFPLAFQSFNDYKPPLAIYLVAVSELLFGVSDWAVRFPAAVFGWLAIPLLYILVRQLNQKKELALLAAGLLAFNPWQIMFSRAMMETGIALTLILAATVSFLFGRKKPFFWGLAAIFFAGSLYVYHSARLFTPFFCGFLLILFWKEIKTQKAIIFSMLLGLLLLMPLFWDFGNGNLLVRARGISIFANIPSPDPYKVELKRLMQDGGGYLARIQHNRRWVDFNLGLNGYLKHFSPAFLFSKHGEDKFEFLGGGLFYLWELFSIVAGIFVMARKKNKEFWLLIIWLLLSPLASAFSFSTPSAVRAMPMLVPLTIFSAAGVERLLSKVRNKIVLFLIIGV